MGWGGRETKKKVVAAKRPRGRRLIGCEQSFFGTVINTPCRSYAFHFDHPRSWVSSSLFDVHPCLEINILLFSPMSAAREGKNCYVLSWVYRLTFPNIEYCAISSLPSPIPVPPSPSLPPPRHCCVIFHSILRFQVRIVPNKHSSAIRQVLIDVRLGRVRDGSHRDCWLVERVIERERDGPPDMPGF